MSETEETTVQIDYEWLGSSNDPLGRGMRSFVCLSCGATVAETIEVKGRILHSAWHQKYANLNRAVEMTVEASTQMVGILERLISQVETLSKSSSTVMRKLLGR